MINIIKRLYQKLVATRSSFSRLVFLHNVFPNRSRGLTLFQAMFNCPANFSLTLPSPDQIPSLAHQMRQKQLLINLRQQRLSFKRNPLRLQLPVGTRVCVYDKDLKTYPRTAKIIEKLWNSSSLLEFDDPEGQILPRHVRHLRPFSQAETTVQKPNRGGGLIRFN